MKILFTGTSSFTGSWFIRELASAGHEVLGILRRPVDDYEGIRRTRVQGLAGICQLEPGCAFGDARFLELINSEAFWDVLCHHAAEVTNYKSPDFDVATAISKNTRNLPHVLEVLNSKGCGKIVLTGSVFENGEGAGSEGLPAFSPYGLSKALTAQTFEYYAKRSEMCLGKFVIPNPFGPYEEPRFTSYLVRSWCERKVPTVNTPDDVRDNIHVSLLAKAYSHFVEHLKGGCGFVRLNPSGYPTSQGIFAKLFAAELRERLGLPCEVELTRQTSFTEPRVRINTDVLDKDVLGWSESEAWDELADYYREMFGPAVDSKAAQVLHTVSRNSH